MTPRQKKTLFGILGAIGTVATGSPVFSVLSGYANTIQTTEVQSESTAMLISYMMTENQELKQRLEKLEQEKGSKP